MKIVKVTLARLVRETRTAYVIVEDGEEPDDVVLAERAWDQDEETDWAGLAWSPDTDWGVDEGTHTIDGEVKLLGPDDVPKVGDIIYVGSAIHIDTPYRDDFTGGLAVVTFVQPGKDTAFLRIRSRADVLYGWTTLAPRQQELAERFKHQWAHIDQKARL